MLESLGFDLDVLTPKELDALRIALEPRSERGKIDKALGTTPQARWNAKNRAARRLEEAAKARLNAA